MEEKKKRFRPTLTAYRALEKEIDELHEQNRLLARENKVLTDEVDGLCALRSDCRAIEQSNALMEQELTGLVSLHWRKRMTRCAKRCMPFSTVVC